MFILYCKTLLLLLRRDTGKIRDMFGGMGRFKGGLRCKGFLFHILTYIRVKQTIITREVCSFTEMLSYNILIKNYYIQ